MRKKNSNGWKNNFFLVSKYKFNKFKLNMNAQINDLIEYKRLVMKLEENFSLTNTIG